MPSSSLSLPSMLSNNLSYPFASRLGSRQPDRSVGAVSAARASAWRCFIVTCPARNVEIALNGCLQRVCPEVIILIAAVINIIICCTGKLCSDVEFLSQKLAEGEIVSDSMIT